MRTNKWLRNKLEKILTEYFSDLELKNEIVIKFGQDSQRRLGSIALKRIHYFKNKISLITISGYMRQESVPEEVILITIAHELVHYSHGFNSLLPRLYRYPHQGNIVDLELRRRGLSAMLRFEKDWVKKNWLKTLAG